MHGGDRVRVRAHPLLEQLVDPAVGQVAVRPGEAVELEAQLLGREQALPAVLGVRVGGDQRERGEVVAGDPGGGRRVEHVGPVAQPQDRSAVAVDDPDLQRCFVGVAARAEDGVERRPGQAQLAPQVVDGKVGVRPQLGLGPMRLADELAPQAGRRGEPARQRPPVRPGRVADHDVRFTGQGGQHHGVRGQHHRPQRYFQPA